jgi:Protein of unknown function (DUF3489)
MANTINKATFTIDDQNRIATHSEGTDPVPSLARFATQQELDAVTADWPNSRLVDVWNQIPGNIAVKKFTNRRTAIHRIWKRLESRVLSAAMPPDRQSKPRDVKSQNPTVAQTAGTKAETVIALLRQPGGSTLKALMAATGWQAHSVRGFISGQLTKKLRLKVKSIKRDGERVYSIRF